MRLRLTSLWASIGGWFLRYDHLQSGAIFLLYLQVICSMIGSLGVMYNGVLLANLVLALFALVAVESGSQKLGRTYLAMLALALLLDIAWFILFANEIWQASKYTKFGKLPVVIVLWMQCISFGLHVVSSLIWLMMYRLGLTVGSSALYQPIDFDRRIETLFAHSPSLPTLSIDPQEEVLGGSIYDPAYYYSLFPDPEGYYSGSKDMAEKPDPNGRNTEMSYSDPNGRNNEMSYSWS